jgi:hypothetical protein
MGLNKKLQILFRFVNLGLILALTFAAIISIIWAKATNGDSNTNSILDCLGGLTIIIASFFLYFLTKRLSDKLKHRNSLRSLIIIELTFIFLAITILLFFQISMILSSFDIVIFLGLLFIKLILIVVGLDTFKDFQISK